MTAFEQFEQQGRNTFQAFVNSNPEIYDLTFTTGEYDSTDGTFMSAFTSCSFELKKRKINSNTTWPNTPDGFILEKTKFDALKASNCAQQLFITIFTDSIVIWDITNLNPTWHSEQLACNHLRQSKREKQVHYLTLSQATHQYKWI